MTAVDPGAIADIGSDQADLAPSTAQYARRFEGPTGSWLLSRQTEALRRLIAPWPGASVLDVGGGHGQVAAPLVADGHPVQVHATSAQALGRAADMPGVVTGTGPLMPLPHADGAFDIVTSFRILAHIGDWPAYLAELTRVARRAVIVDFAIPGGVNALEPLLFGVKKKIEGDTRRYAAIPRREICARLAELGFADQQTVGQFVLPMVLHRKLKQPGLSSALEGSLRAIRLDRLVGTPVVLCAARSPSHT
ncbi:class I SAM-dependent methyltransferase [Marinibacterium sp. SX1]|uniref:class I SAM-dependent methyltransferase n=1 Tax=Marinibacterium sp. SX1 TaxID=3388424 RepID=UPI003D1776B1